MQKKRPLFSVLIANHNDGNYLQNTIDSVFAQTYDNWEIIIVDDKSTDNSEEIYKKYANDTRIHIYRNDENRGCGYTKRRCVDLAQGEICGFVDADDSITPNAIEVMTEAHIKEPQCSLIYSQFYYTDENLNVTSVSQHQCTIPEGKSFLTCNILGAVSHFVTFKKNYYNQTAGIDPSFKIAEDIDLYFKLEEVGKLLFIPTPLYYYRIGTGNNTSLGKNNQLKSISWDLLARINAYQRRHLPIEDILIPKMTHIYDEAFTNGQNDVRNTNSYKIGKAIITPFRSIAKLFSK